MSKSSAPGYRSLRDADTSTTSTNEGGWLWLSRRSGWFYGCTGGVVAILNLAIVASFVMGIVGIGLAKQSLHQAEYHTSTRITPSPLAHVALGMIPLVLNLPNDLSDFVGKLYHFDCGSAASHAFVILPGALDTSWTGVSGVRTATCLGIGGGFSVRVISSSRVRLVDPENVSFT